MPLIVCLLSILTWSFSIDLWKELLDRFSDCGLIREKVAMMAKGIIFNLTFFVALGTGLSLDAFSAEPRKATSAQVRSLESNTNVENHESAQQRDFLGRLISEIIASSEMSLDELGFLWDPSRSSTIEMLDIRFRLDQLKKIAVDITGSTRADPNQRGLEFNLVVGEPSLTAVVQIKEKGSIDFYRRSREPWYLIVEVKGQVKKTKIALGHVDIKTSWNEKTGDSLFYANAHVRRYVGEGKEADPTTWKKVPFLARYGKGPTGEMAPAIAWGDLQVEEFKKRYPEPRN